MERNAIVGRRRPMLLGRCGFARPFWPAIIACLAAGCNDEASGGDPTCGPGTVEDDNGICTAELSCGVGTEQVGEACVFAGAEATCAAGTELTAEGCVVAPDACGEGTTLVDGTCVASGDPGTTCGTGTELSGTECALASEACGAGTSLDSGQCVPSEEICVGETTLGENGCEVGAGACGAGSELLEGICELDSSACGAGTQISDGMCEATFEPISCGEGTELVADSCVGTLTCGRGAEEVQGEGDAPECLADEWASIDVFTAPVRLATQYCESFYGCCEPVDLDEMSFEGVIDPRYEFNTCVEVLSLLFDMGLGFYEARSLETESPGSVEFDLEAYLDWEEAFTATETCKFPLTPALLADAEDDGPRFWQGSLQPGAQCLTDFSCEAGLVCLRSTDEGPSHCGNPFEMGDPCAEHEYCSEGLFCEFQAETPTCQPQRGLNELCYDDEDCGTDVELGDLTCMNSVAGGPSVCRELGAPGYYCSGNGDNDDCPEGMYCNDNDWFCYTKRDAGAFCQDSDECVTGTTCDDVCTAEPDVCDTFIFGD